MVNGSMVDVPVKKVSFKEILHAVNVKGILERQWRRKKNYVIKWKLEVN